MKIRFQADNDLHENIMRATKRFRPRSDFQRATELNLHTGVNDLEILRLCAEQNRMLVTHDRQPCQIISLSSSSLRNHPVFSLFQEGCPLAKRQNGWSYFGKLVKRRNIGIKSLIFHDYESISCDKFVTGLNDKRWKMMLIDAIRQWSQPVANVDR